MGCADSGLTSGEQNEEDARRQTRAQNKEGGFNRTYVNEDGKIDKARLFGNVLANKSLGWNELRSQLMQKGGIRSPHFAETLMQEAQDGGLLQTLLINGRREYLLRNQQQLFDEVPVRLVLLAPFKGGNVRTKEREGNLSNRTET